MPLPWGWLVLFIGKGPGPLPKYLSGKGANNCPIRRGTSGTLILTKVGPRLPKALCLAPPKGLGSCVDEVGPCWAPLSHAAGRRQASLGTPVPITPTEFV